MIDGSNLKQGAALVTGGSRGIGRAVALALAEHGFETVIVNFLENDGAAEVTRKGVEARGARCVLVKANLAHPAEIDRLFVSVTDAAPSLAVYVHCAALGAFKPICTTKPNHWDITMNVGARSFLLCAQKCFALMKAGAIIAISSLGSARVLANYGAIGVSKAALESTVRYLAVELAPLGIRVNAVSAGLVRTESIDKMPYASRLLQDALARTPAGRVAEPGDVVDVVMFLASPAARWIYGQVILADGGYSLT
jgi:enoyl-[acyl-carrier protein] reductase III